MGRADAPASARIAGAFAAGRAQGRALLMPFLVCGYPSEDAFVDTVRACGEAGADVLEFERFALSE